MQVGDILQVNYKRTKNWTFEIVQGPFVGKDDEWIYLTENRRFKISKIVGLRNLTKEQLPPGEEDE